MKRVLFTLFLLLAAGQALAVGQLADIAVYDRMERRLLPVYWHEGKAYVVGRPGNEYQIALRNRAGQDVLAIVSVDGVNVVTGETAAASQSGYVIDTWQNVEIKGWRKSLDRIAAFYFTALPDSYAARTGRPDNVGVIGVALFRRRAAEPPLSFNAPSSPFKRDRGESADRSNAPGLPPAAAGQADASARAQEKSLGTGHGRGETSHARQVGFERATTGPEEVVTLYYDSYANLVALGVIKPDYRPERRREPQPFPAHFVADPPGRW